MANHNSSPEAVIDSYKHAGEYLVIVGLSAVGLIALAVSAPGLVDAAKTTWPGIINGVSNAAQFLFSPPAAP